MTGLLFSPGIPVFITNKTDRHDITEILLKVALNIITLPLIVGTLWGTDVRPPLGTVMYTLETFKITIGRRQQNVLPKWSSENHSGGNS